MSKQQEIMRDIHAEETGLSLLVEDFEKRPDRFNAEAFMAMELLESLEFHRAVKALSLGIVQTHRIVLQRKEDSGHEQH